MHRNFSAWVCGVLLLLGCQSHPVAPLIDPEDALLTPPRVIALDGHRIESVAAEHLWHFDLAHGTVTVEPVASRSGMQAEIHELGSSDEGWLPMSSWGLSVIQVEMLPGDRLEATYLLQHPFPAPSDPTAPANAMNRADLGVTGHLELRVFVPQARRAEQTFFDDLLTNTRFLLNADGYYNAGRLLSNGSGAYAYPYRMLVDESGDGNRLDIPNGGDPRGNFGADGWTRAELGPDRTGWTGYGVLHQGQRVKNKVLIDQTAVEELHVTTIRTAIVVRYQDPRGGTTGAEKRTNRLPPDPPDFRKFAYRMPYGAWDCERVVVHSGLEFVATEAGESRLRLHLQDADFRAPESSLPLDEFAQEPDLGKCPPGTTVSGRPLFELSLPGVLQDTVLFDQPVDDDSQFGGDLGPDSGRTGDLIFYEQPIVKPARLTDRAGTYAGLLSVIDPEMTVRSSYYTAYDPDLQPLPASESPIAQTYQAVWVTLSDPECVSQPGMVIPILGEANSQSLHDLAVDPLDGSIYLAGSTGGTFDFDPGSGVQENDHTSFLAKYSAAGALLWLRDHFVLALVPDGTGHFYSAGAQNGFNYHDAEGTVVWSKSLAGASVLFDLVWRPDGSVALAGLADTSVDLDPGPEEQRLELPGERASLICVALHPDGSFQSGGAVTADIAWYDNRHGLARTESGLICVGTAFAGTGDFDPGPGVIERTALGARDPFYVVLDPAADMQAVAVHTFENGLGELQGLACHGERIAATGTYSGAIDLDPTAGVDLHPGDSQSLFLSVWSLDEDAPLLSLTYVTSSATWGREVCWTANNKLLLLGENGNRLDFDPGPGLVSRERSAFVATFHAGETLESVMNWEGDVLLTHVVPNVDAQRPGSMAIFGLFSPGADLDPNPLKAFVPEAPSSSWQYFSEVVLAGGRLDCDS